MAYDDLTKQILKHKYGDAVKTEVKVGDLEKSFDILLKGNHPTILSSDLIPDLFKQYEYNIMEYKSAHDTYNMYDILKLNGDFSYFSYNNHFNLNYAFKKSCLWFIVANRNPFNNLRMENGIVPDPECNTPGYYFLPSSNPHIRVIVLDELDILLKSHTFLLFFASAKKFGSFAKVLVKDNDLLNELKKYINAKLLIEGKDVSEMEDVDTLKEKSGFTAADNIRYSIDVLGLENVIGAVGFKKIVSSIGLDKIIAESELADVIKSIPTDRYDEIAELMNKFKNQEDNENP